MSTKKIWKDRDALIQRIEQLRADGCTVVTACGCFELLHVGHVRYLSGAAEQADRLVVAINSDSIVTALKGQRQPILPEDERAELVAALCMVDYVVVFSTPTVADLLEVLRPNVHCKGTDYTVDTVPEREIVRRYGGRTMIVGDPKNHSTQSLLTRIAERLRAPARS